MSHSIRRALGNLLVVSAVILSAGSTSPTAQAGSFTWTGAVSSDWFTPGNWAPNGVPGAVDTVTINGGIANVPTDATIGALTFSAGTIQGAGTLTVTGPMTWTGNAQMIGSGTTVIGPAATVLISGSVGSRTISQGRTLTNNGTLTVVNTGSGTAFCGGGFVINNAGTMEFGAASSFTVCNGGPGTINNSGTLIKSTASDIALLDQTLVNTGTVDVQGGELRLGNFSTYIGTGAINVAPGATLNFQAGVHSLNTGSSMSGAGDVLINTTINVNADVAIRSLNFKGGTIQGAGTLAVTGQLTWTAGQMSGSGVTVIAAGATANVSGPGTKAINLGRTLTNNGTLTVAGTGTVFGFCGGGFVLNNAGTMSLGSGGSFMSCNGPPGTINNTGTLIKSGAADISLLDQTLVNAGTVDVSIGELKLGLFSTYLGTGALRIAAGSTLNFSSAVHTLNPGSSITGAGNLIVTAVINVNTNLTVPVLTFSGGTLQGPGTLEVTQAFAWTAGQMSGAGTLVIAEGATARISGPGTKTLIGGRTMANAGSLVLATPVGNSQFCGRDAAINNSGTFDIQGDGGIGSCSGSVPIVFNNTGTLRKSSGAGMSQVFGTVTTSGRLELLSGTINLAEGLTQTAGVTLLNGGDLSLLGYGDPPFVLLGGVVAGTGVIEGNLTNASTVSPGLAPGAAGTIRVTGNYTQTASGRLKIELGGVTPATEFDRLILGTAALTKTATFGGVLDIQLVNGFQPAANDSFEVTRYSLRVNQFPEIAGADLGNNQALTADYRPNNLVLIAGPADGGTTTGCGSPARIWAQIIAPRTARLHNFAGGTLYKSTILYGNSGGTGAFALITAGIGNLKPEHVVSTTGVIRGPVVPVLDADVLAAFETLPTVMADAQTGYRSAPMFVFIPPDNPLCDASGGAGEPGGGGTGAGSGAGAGSAGAVSGLSGVTVSVSRDGSGGGGGTGGGGTGGDTGGGGGTGGGGTGGGGTGGGAGDGGGTGGGGGGTGGGGTGGGGSNSPNPKACDVDFISENDLRATQVDTSRIAACLPAVGDFLRNYVPGNDCLNAMEDGVKRSRGASVPLANSILNVVQCAASFGDVSGMVGAALSGADQVGKAQALADAVQACQLGPNGFERNKTNFVFSCDPNDKVGTFGAGTPSYISGDVPTPYSISFENKPDATAPAQEVVITDQLDTNTLDLSTFKLSVISFGDTTVVPPPNLSEFNTEVDLRPANNLLVRINAKLDTTTGLLTYRFGSIDPATLQPTLDPLAGFLPPNRLPAEGQGSVLFTVSPKAGLTSGTQINNGAKIFFDTNDPIDTPVWLNTIDNSPPSSSVQAFPATINAESFAVAWAGTDADSGIASFSIFVSEDGGPFEPWLHNTVLLTADFQGQVGKSYGFYSVAQDNTGNVEAGKTVADATTPVRTDFTSPVTVATLSSPPNAAGWHNADVVVSLDATDDSSGVRDVGYIVTGAQSITGATTSTASATVTVTAEGESTIAFFASDEAGNVEIKQTFLVRLDKTAPTIAVSRTPAPDATGWNDTSVTATYTAADALSGLASPATGTYVFTADGAGQSQTFTVQDLAGNTASATIGNVNIATPPPPPPPPPPAPDADGRMFGSGRLDQGRIQNHFVFRAFERRSQEQAKLEFWTTAGRQHDEDERHHSGDDDRNYGRPHRGQRNRFESTVITSVTFGDAPAVRSVVFAGTGKWNGKSGYTFEASAIDRGEPGRHDRFSLVVKNAAGIVVTSVDGELVGGNVQSTRLSGKGPDKRRR